MCLFVRSLVCLFVCLYSDMLSVDSSLFNRVEFIVIIPFFVANDSTHNEFIFLLLLLLSLLKNGISNRISICYLAHYFLSVLEFKILTSFVLLCCVV